MAGGNAKLQGAAGLLESRDRPSGEIVYSTLRILAAAVAAEARPVPSCVTYTAPPQTRIGHVHLKVADLERALAFYHGVLGFQVTQRMGSQAAFLAAGGYHHHIGLNTWESRGGRSPPPDATGLYHVAILYQSRAALAEVLRRLRDAGIPIDGAADHGVSEALYLRDPDGNGVELYHDRPADRWPRDEKGELKMVTRPLNLESLLSEAPP